MEFGHFVDQLMMVLPFWHYKIDRPFKQTQKENHAAMTLETYYCLQMLRWCGPMTMSELALRLRLTKQQATRTIDRLYQHGLIRRLLEEEDRRVVRIEITEQALKYLGDHVRQNMAFLNGMEQKLGAQEFEEFGKAVETLLRVLPKLD